MNKTYSAADLKFLNLLSEKFPTIADATTEIINLEAILNLPKGTEHFLTDLHGEYEAFRHVLKNASGVIRQKVHEVFNNTLRESEMTELCTLIYYPAEKLQLIKQKESNLDDWYKVTLNQLTEVCRAVSVKYTRSKVRKMLPPDFSYVIQELLHESDSPGSGARSALHFRYAGPVQDVRYPVGQSRHSLDGRCGGEFSFDRQCDPCVGPL